MKKLTKQQMRVAIAKDALAQLRLEKYTPHKGICIDYNLLDKLTVEYKKDYNDKSAQPFLDDIKKCKVCAKGAIYLSTVRKFNEVNLRNFSTDAANKACEIFGETPLNKIEAAFEGWEDMKKDGIVQANTRLNKFIKKYPNPKIRLEKLLLNIIRNKGKFKP